MKNVKEGEKNENDFKERRPSDEIDGLFALRERGKIMGDVQREGEEGKEGRDRRQSLTFTQERNVTQKEQPMTEGNFRGVANYMHLIGSHK